MIQCKRTSWPLLLIQIDLLGAEGLSLFSLTQQSLETRAQKRSLGGSAQEKFLRLFSLFESSHILMPLHDTQNLKEEADSHLLWL